MTPEEQAARDWLERQCFNASEGIAHARCLQEALDSERNTSADNSRAALMYAEELDKCEAKLAVARQALEAVGWEADVNDDYYYGKILTIVREALARLDAE